jgi:hypothetical protein
MTLDALTSHATGAHMDLTSLAANCARNVVQSVCETVADRYTKQNTQEGRSYDRAEKNANGGKSLQPGYFGDSQGYRNAASISAKGMARVVTKAEVDSKSALDDSFERQALADKYFGNPYATNNPYVPNVANPMKAAVNNFFRQPEFGQHNHFIPNTPSFNNHAIFNSSPAVFTPQVVEPTPLSSSSSSMVLEDRKFDLSNRSSFSLTPIIKNDNF